MTDLTKLVAYNVEPPAPMSIFEERVIHPDNAAILKALEERVARFKPLPQRKIVRMQLRVNRLHRILRQRRVFAVVADLNTLHADMHQTYTAYLADKAEARTFIENGEPIPDTLGKHGKHLKNEVLRMQAQLKQMEESIEPWEKMYEEYVSLRDRLAENAAMVARHKEEERNRKQFFKEGKIVKKALTETFLMTEGCHIVRYKRGGKTKKIAPKFQEINLNSMVHSFVLLTSKKNIFGWKPKLQVDIHRLIDPKTTLQNASAILHMPVWVDWDKTHSLPIFKVNRLDMRDGLPEKVLFGGMLEIYPVLQHEFVPIPVGLGESFRARWMDFDRTPHLLIAGATRAGKSNLVNAIICAILYTQSPDEVRFFAIDNKEGVEFNRYRDVPHLIDNIVDTGDKVLPALLAALKMMKQRLRWLNETQTKTIIAFNKAVPARRMPRVIIFIDEMATLLNREDTADIQFALTILTAQGAAAGVHVIMATQYPNSETIPMSVKNNADGIIALRVANFHASNMLLNSDEAYRLDKVKGRAFINDAGDRYKVQTPFISDEENDRAVRFAVTEYERKPFTELGGVDLSETEELLKAPPSPTITFTEYDVLNIALDQFDGALKADQIYDIVKESGIATLRGVRAIVQTIRERGSAELNGITYQAVKQPGNFYKLVEAADDDEMDMESSSAVRQLGTVGV